MLSIIKCHQSLAPGNVIIVNDCRNTA